MNEISTSTPMDDNMEQLFKQLPVEKLSQGFTTRTMSQVLHIAARSQREKRLYNIGLYMSLLCLFIITTGSIIYFTGIDISIEKYVNHILMFTNKIIQPFKYLYQLFSTTSNRLPLLIGLIVLMLLLGDLFLRSWIMRKHDVSEELTR